MGQDSQGFCFVVLIRFLLQPGLCLRVFTQKQNGRFAEGPLQIGIADFAAAGAIGLSCGLMLALYQTCLRGEVLNAGKAVDIMNLTQNSQ